MPEFGDVEPRYLTITESPPNQNPELNPDLLINRNFGSQNIVDNFGLGSPSVSTVSTTRVRIPISDHTQVVPVTIIDPHLDGDSPSVWDILNIVSAFDWTQRSIIAGPITDPTAQPTPFSPFTGSIIDISTNGTLAGGTMPGMIGLGGRIAGGAGGRGLMVSGIAAWAITRAAASAPARAAGASRIGALVARLPGPLRTALKFTGGVLIFEAISSLFSGDDTDGQAVAMIGALIQDGIDDGSILFRGGNDRFGNETVPKYLTVGPLDSNNVQAWIHSRYYSAKSISAVRRTTNTKWFRGRGGRRQSRNK